MPCYKEKVENSNAFVDRVVREGSGKETRKCVKLRLRKERVEGKANAVCPDAVYGGIERVYSVGC